MAGWPLTILFMPESAYGPTNNCIGMATCCASAGTVVFAAEARGAGGSSRSASRRTWSTWPARERRANRRRAGRRAVLEGLHRRTAPEFRKPTIEQLDTWIRPVWAELIDGAKYCHDQLTEIIARVRPDVIVEDNVVAFPALMTAGVPFVRIVSCQPLEVKDPGAAAPVLRLPGRRPGRLGRVPRRVRPGAPRRCGPTSTPGSPARARRPCPTWSSSTRARPTCTSTPSWPTTRGPGRSGRAGCGWTPRCGRRTRVPAARRAGGRPAAGDGALIYFSLGSLGSADVGLMRRVIGALAQRRTGSSCPRARCTPRSTWPRTCGGPSSAADLGAPAGRPGDHARRQQHHHRGPALRQAHDRAAAVLGPARQRAARWTSSASASGWTPTASPTASCTAPSTGCSATRAAGPAGRGAAADPGPPGPARGRRPHRAGARAHASTGVTRPSCCCRRPSSGPGR